MGGTIEEEGNVSQTVARLIPNLHHIKANPECHTDHTSESSHCRRASTNNSVKRLNPYLQVAEFNIYADSIASARVYALTSPTPSSTLPPSPPPSTFSPPKAKSLLQSYPNSLPRQLNLTMFPLDITMRHILDQGDWDATVESLIKEGSPLAEWANVFMASTFKVMEERHVVAGRESRPKDVGIALHDPLTICA